VLRGILYLLYFLVVLYCVRLVTRAVGRVFGPGSDVRRPGRAPRPSSGRAEDLVHDRVCNTHVPRSRALTEKVAGREEYFCSEACRDRARAEVARAS
jgi:YHS domain-containing protein